MSLSRRSLIAGAATGALGLGLAGCERLSASPEVNRALKIGEAVTRRAQRVIVDRKGLAREYPVTAISRDFRANGTTAPDSEDYNALLASGFRDWRLEIGGLVERPLSLSLADLRGAAGRRRSLATTASKVGAVSPSGAGRGSGRFWIGPALSPALAMSRSSAPTPWS